MADSYCMVLTTTGDRMEAEKIAALLVQRGLAACVQITAVTSFYMWKGALRDDGEFLLLIKTVDRRYEDIEAAIRANHSYDVPEIIQVPIQRGAESYLGWVTQNTA